MTPLDLGLDWIISRKKPDFVGRRSLSRPHTARSDRLQLVGLHQVDDAPTYRILLRLSFARYSQPGYATR